MEQEVGMYMGVGTQVSYIKEYIQMDVVADADITNQGLLLDKGDLHIGSTEV